VGPSPALGPAGVAPPPFARPQPQQRKSRPADPFATSAAPAAHEVRLVIDEKPVDDAEVGRKKKGLLYIMMGIGLALGLAVGLGAGSINAERRIYNLAVQDGDDIYASVRTASDTVNKAKGFVDSAIAAARGAGGRPPSVDRQAIEKLRGLEKPFAAHQFAQRRYSAFSPVAVDALFHYYNNVQLLWSRFEGLNAVIAGEDRRRQLEESCAAAGAVASTKVGCALARITQGEGEQQISQLVCSLGAVQPLETATPPAAGEPPRVRVCPSIRDRRCVERTVLLNQNIAEVSGEEEAVDPGTLVVEVDVANSLGILGQPASLCAEYQRELIQVKTLMDDTIAVQGRLEQELGNVARLEPIFAF
jgi:hypothetical protein